MSTNSYCIFLICALLAITDGVKSQTIDLQAEVKKIKELDRHYDAAVQARDLEKSMSFFAHNIIQMPQESPSIIGYDEVYKRTKIFIESLKKTPFVSSFSPDTIEVASSGDLAYDRGTSRLSNNTSKGLIENVGKYVNIWKKIDGQWKIIVQIYNQDAPWKKMM